MTELLHLENYSFTYPQQRRPALSHVTLTVPEGAFMVLCGPSGCGKSTLLRQLKTVLAPHGLREGEITFCGTPLSQIPGRRQAAEIGFVQQSPENQVVTDKGDLFFVLATEGDFLLLADGKRRRVEDPKRKRRKHTELYGESHSPVAEKIRSGEKITNSELRKALAAFSGGNQDQEG